LNPATYTVSEITADIKLNLEDQFHDVVVEGELSGFKRHSSGHCYFTLKDENSQLRGVMFRSQAEHLSFAPKDGMAIRARGNISVYAQRGDYQLLVMAMRPAGEGQLARAFQELKRKLHAEGLFDAQHKKDLPRFPEKIGLVTSRDGAAAQDIFSTLARRFPQAEVLFVPTAVQGPGAAEQIAEAVNLFNAHDEYRPDLIIMGRGGGSIEDLWAFNEEVVARAVFASEVPIICAVGHETDFSIAEFVADLRAATPTMAAELATPDRQELIGQMHAYLEHYKNTVLRQIESNRRKVEAIRESRAFNTPINYLREAAMRLDRTEEQLNISMNQQLQKLNHRIEIVSNRISDLNPSKPLEKGFALVSREGAIVNQASSLSKDDTVTLRFKDGSKDSVIK